MTTQHTPEQRIEAVAQFWDYCGRYDIAKGLRMAKRLIQPDGEDHVAPAWYKLPLDNTEPHASND